jgi:hypothetical protein
MDTVSLYDKYHSQHNKSHMFNLITKFIQDDYSEDMSTNRVYNQFFETNFKNTFQKVDTEDLKDLNKSLLTTQIDYYNNFISKNETLTSTSDNQVDDMVDETNEGHMIIHSIQRIIHLKHSNRFSYKMNNHQQHSSCVLEKVILPIEDNYLFANPLLIIAFDNYSIQLHLRGTMTLGAREYGIYSPFYESTFNLALGKIHISLNNQLSTHYKECDVYKINSYQTGILEVDYESGEFKKGDYIRICNFENIDLDDGTCLNEQYKVTKVVDNTLYINTDTVLYVGLYVMNISLQHSIHISYR